MSMDLDGWIDAPGGYQDIQWDRYRTTRERGQVKVKAPPSILAGVQMQMQRAWVDGCVIQLG